MEPIEAVPPSHSGATMVGGLTVIQTHVFSKQVWMPTSEDQGLLRLTHLWLCEGPSFGAQGSESKLWGLHPTLFQAEPDSTYTGDAGLTECLEVTEPPNCPCPYIPNWEQSSGMTELLLVDSRSLWHCTSPREYSWPWGNRVLELSVKLTETGSQGPAQVPSGSLAKASNRSHSRVSGIFSKPGCSGDECLVSAGEIFN